MNKQWLIIRPKVLPISFHIDRRVPVILLVLTLVTLLAMVLSVGYGEYPISPVDVVKTLLGIPTANRDYAFIINTLRLPRTIVAFLVGVGLAIAVTITQGITRNPLAAPGIIGIDAGATLVAVSLIILLPNAPVSLLPFAAFSGALAIAMVLAQDTDILLLDEPTTFLDLSHQVDLLDLLDELQESKGKTIVMILHDLNLSCRYADYLVAVQQGKVYATGTPQQVMTEETVKDVFNLECRIVFDPLSDTPMCIPMGRKVQATRRN